MARCSHYCTQTFRKQRKAAHIPRREFLEKGTELAKNPSLGNPLVGQDGTIRVWQTKLNGQVYEWHYIWLDEYHEIQSVSLLKGSVPAGPSGPDLPQVFYMKIFAIIVGEIVKSILEDS